MGIEGSSLARYFLGQGAQVTVHHFLPIEKLLEKPDLAQQYNQLRAAGAEFHLGAEYLSDVLESDAIGIVQSAFTYKYPQNAPVLNAARSRGIPLLTDLKIFFEMSPLPIIGITGTNGKTTTTELAEAVLRAGGREVYAGGNLGVSPLDILPILNLKVKAGHGEGALVLLELSNYQLEHLDRSPWIACITNIQPDHLVDYGGSFEAYQAAKRRIVAYQGHGDWSVLNLDDPITADVARSVRGRLFPFSRRLEPDQGAYVRAGRIAFRRGRREESVCAIDELKLRGEHNLENVLAAVAIGALCEIPAARMGEAVTQFMAGEHRIEFVREWRGVSFYNDSKSTTPASTLAAVRSFPGQPIVLLAGGRDKGLPWSELAQAIQARVRYLIAFGEAAALIADEMSRVTTAIKLPSQPGGTVVERAESLEAAFARAIEVAQPGDVVLLSPACTSFDAFNDYAERGRRFKALVEQLEVQGYLAEGRA